MKKCQKCNIELTVDNWKVYHQKHGTKICAFCATQIKREYYLKNKEAIDKDNKRRYIENAERCKERARQWRKENSERKKELDRQYRIKNNGKLKEHAKEYAANNKERITTRQKKWYEDNREHCLLKAKINREKPESKKNRNIMENKRKREDLEYKLKTDISKHVHTVLKYRNMSKGMKFAEYMPFTIKDLIIHIEKLFTSPNNLNLNGEVWMNWSNRGMYDANTWDDNNSTTWKWQIDHIIPQSDFQFTTVQDISFKECWSLNNLRPLSAKTNVLDGVKRTRHKK